MIAGAGAAAGLGAGTWALVFVSSRTSSWDTCGPEALLHEAGGRLTDLDGAPLRYDQAGTHHLRGLIASNTLVHDAAVGKIAPLFPTTE